MNGWLLNRVETIVAKGEIACYEQFLLLSQCFQKSSAAEASKSVCMTCVEGLINVIAQYIQNHHSKEYSVLISMIK